MINGVAAIFQLLIEHRNAERVRQAVDLRLRAGKSDEARIKVLQIAAELAGRVAFGIDGNEHELRLLILRDGNERGFDLRQLRQRRGADIGTAGIAEEQHAPVIFEQRLRLCLALRVVEFEGGQGACNRQYRSSRQCRRRILRTANDLRQPHAGQGRYNGDSDDEQDALFLHEPVEHVAVLMCRVRLSQWARIMARAQRSLGIVYSLF